MRLRVPKIDEKGRRVAVGAEGVIVHCHPVQAGESPAYTVEVVITDERGVQCDAHLFDALHSEVDRVSP